MTFADWQALDPTPAAREFLRRATTALSPAQQRAVFAHLPTEAELITHFATAPAGAPLAGVPYLAKDLFDVAGFEVVLALGVVGPHPRVAVCLQLDLDGIGVLLHVVR